MAIRIRQKNRREIVEQSLLERPDVETQVKDKPQVILRVVILSLLFVLLAVNYYLVFSSQQYPRMFATICTGTFNASNYVSANDCDLIVVDKYKNITEIKVGDVVCFATNIEKGSGKVLKVSQGIVSIEKTDKTILKLNYNLVVGKQVKTVPVLGFFLAVLQNYIGVIVLSLLIVIYLSYITFSKINYENTEHGKALYKKLKAVRYNERERRKLLKKLETYTSPETVISSILDNDYEENLRQLNSFDINVKGRLKDKYKFVLECVHSAYLSNNTRTVSETNRIVSVVELMCEAEGFDIDMEYMLIDLIVSQPMVDFDIIHFACSAKKFIGKTVKTNNLLRFGSVLFILLKQNQHLKNDEMREVVDEYKNKCLEHSKDIDKKDALMVVEMAKAITNQMNISKVV